MKLTTFLMFTGQAHAAMTFYTELFGGTIDRVTRADDGTVQHALFTIAGQQLACIDSPPVHDFTFTPSMSLAVTCDSEQHIDRLFAALSDGGKVLMPLAAYPFATKYGWCNDRFGVSWQLTLP